MALSTEPYLLVSFTLANIGIALLVKFLDSSKYRRLAHSYRHASFLRAGSWETLYQSAGAPLAYRVLVPI